MRRKKIDYSAVERYARAERSDPFAAGRAVTHLKSGAAENGDYDAEASKDDYGRKIWKNVKRA